MLITVASTIYGDVTEILLPRDGQGDSRSWISEAFGENVLDASIRWCVVEVATSSPRCSSSCLCWEYRSVRGQRFSQCGKNHPKWQRRSFLDDDDDDNDLTSAG